MNNSKLRFVWAFGFVFLVAVSADASSLPATTPNELLAGVTGLTSLDYENLYDPNGNIATSPAIGDTIQGVVVVNQVSNTKGKYYYSPVAGTTELTGVFDAQISGIDSAGNLILVPDTTAVVGQKALSGAAFQATYGNGTNNAMLALYYNGSDAMPVEQNGNGLVGLTTATQAVNLATTGTFWASFGANGAWGSGYYWASEAPVAAGVTPYALSLGFVDNATGIPDSSFLPLTQSPPAALSSDSTLFTIPNDFVNQGTINSAASVPAAGGETVYSVFSNDFGQMSVVPEPSTLALLGVFFGLLAVLPVYRRKLGG